MPAEAMKGPKEKDTLELAAAMKSLSKYYKWSGFDKSPEFARFSEWADKNQDRLSAAHADAQKSGMFPKDDSPFMRGYWLGSTYLAENECGAGARMPKVELGRKGGWNPTLKSIFINEKRVELQKKIQDSETDAFIAGFNNGLHEHAHALPYLKGKDGSLSELAAVMATSKYGLPLRSGERLVAFVEGKRDFLHAIRNLEERGEDIRTVLNEYLSSAIIPWIGKYYGGKLDVNDYEAGFSWRAKRGEETLGSLYAASEGGLVNAKKEKINGKEQEFVSIGTFSKEAFFATEGIKDEELRKKLGKVFDRLTGAGYADGKKFLDAFVREMDKEFGRPDRTDIPRDFVHNSVPKRVESA